ncbi:MAG: hypothetical protein JWN12_9 [Candidatus Saccharibacteria bacterium]|nr:hypothetical protein [Candidatus Saccharibacteria bacterium]
MALFTSNTTQQSLHDRLVEIESVIGGNLFPKPAGVTKQRFWYHQGDWFYETHDAVGPMVARYQFANGQAHKLVDGKPIAFAEGEIDNLHKMIQRYRDEVYAQLYAPRNDTRVAA